MQTLCVHADAPWELLVINNNCTDHTDDVIARHAERLPIRRIFESRQGKSHACNTAVSAARGDLLLWTDDDVLVDPNWLSSYCSAAQRWPQAVSFGGPVAPWYECPPPSWIVKNRHLLQGMLVVRDYGEVERPFSENELPFGANMALRRSVFDHLRFDPQLGPNEDSRLIGEETILLKSLIDRGWQGVAVPEAKVRHWIPASRMTPEYLWRWAYGWGRTTVRMERDAAQRRAQPMWRMRVNCWRHALRYYWRRRLRRGDWVSPLYSYATTSGVIAELQNSCGRETRIVASDNSGFRSISR